MITKNDCLMLLAELSDSGVDTKDAVNKVVKNTSIDLEVLKFINSYKTFDVLNFYDKLRVNYNNKRSKLYKCIVQVDEKEPRDIVVTLASLLTQILLHSNYFKTYDLTLCITLLKLIKADLKALESLNKVI